MTKKVDRKSLSNKIIKVLTYGYGFTSVAGISQSRASDCRIHKYLWILAFIVGSSFTTYQVYNALLTYKKHNTETSITLKNKVKLDFPSVTVCNQNRVHCRHLYNRILECNKVGIAFLNILNNLQWLTNWCNIESWSYCWFFLE